MNENDGIDEVVEGGLRAGLMAAARIGEQLARMREQQQREIQRAEEARARELQDRFTAQQAAARAQLEPVARDDWWDKATPDMIERAHETATAWKTYDPVSAEHAARIQGEVRQRYGIDTNNPGADEHAVSAVIHRAQQERAEAHTEPSTASAARTDETLVAAAIAGADREDNTRAANRETDWDAPERRQALAASLADHPDQEAVRARLIADKHQAKPPSAAVQARPAALKTAGPATESRDRTLERGGLQR